MSPPLIFNISFYLNNVSYQIEFETRVQLHRTLQISPCSIVSQFKQSPWLQLQTNYWSRMTWIIFVNFSKQYFETKSIWCTNLNIFPANISWAIWNSEWCNHINIFTRSIYSTPKCVQYLDFDTHSHSIQMSNCPQFWDTVGQKYFLICWKGIF